METRLDQGILEQEMKDQEARANRRTMYGLYGVVALITIIWIFTYLGVFDVNKHAINSGLICALIFTVFPLALGYSIDLSSTWYKWLCLSCLSVACSVAFSQLSFHTPLLMAIPIIFASQYKSRLALWVTYAIDNFSFICASIYGFYNGLCDLNVLIVSNNTYDYYINSETGALQNLTLNDNYVYILVFYAGITKALITLILVFVLQMVNTQSRQDAVRIAKLQWKSGTDHATKTFNKGKFEEMSDKIYPYVNWVAVIFWDLNDLKPINDSLGHAMGDAYIKKLADALMSVSNDGRRSVFRMGGDEFIMVIDHPSEDEPERIINHVQKTLQLEELNGMTITASAGYAVGRGNKINELVKEADEKMYQNKKQSKEDCNAIR
ncbi:MAG: GGDEF domain-containing protein [Pseudobutyrivibrio sp.]|nr:GGDEF domain-containing protein [Pseudobutyrivibrio sp.]